MKILFFDLETTGFGNNCGIHQIGLILMINGEIISQINYHVNPGDVAFYAEALALANKTREDIMAHESIVEALGRINYTLVEKIDREDENDKWVLCGYNNHRFDNRFWKSAYENFSALKYDELFHEETLDVSKNVRAFFKERNEKPENFSLLTIAKYFELHDESGMVHTADYDALLTMKIFNKVNELNNGK